MLCCDSAVNAAFLLPLLRVKVVEDGGGGHWLVQME